MFRYLHFFLILLLPGILNAQTMGIRKYSNEFLTIGASPRGMAMANSIVASVDDVTSSYYNPAGLALINHTMQFSFMHSEYFGGITSYDYAAAAFKLDRMSALGISFVRFGADNIPNTYDLVDQNGAINYDNVTNFSVANYALILSYGRKFNEMARYHGYLIRYGGSVKIVRNTVGPFANSWGFGVDAAVQVQVDDHSTIGILLKDASNTFNAWNFTFTDAQKNVLLQTGNDIPVHSTEITLPRLIIGGNRTYNLNKEFSLMGEADMDITFDGRRNVLMATEPISFDPHIGLEAAYKKTICLRLGFGNFQYYTDDNPDNKKVFGFSPSIGLGLMFKKLTLDYALTNLGSTSPGLYSHIVGLRLTIDRAKKH